MKRFLVTTLLVSLICSAAVFAKPAGDKLEPRVILLEETTTIQQGQIDENTDGRVILEGLTSQQQEQIDQNDSDIGWLGGRLDVHDVTLEQHQDQIDQNDADIGLLWEADAQQQEQIDAIAATPQPIEPQKITSAPMLGVLLSCQLINVSDRAYDAVITIQPFSDDPNTLESWVPIGGYAYHAHTTSGGVPDFAFCTIEWTGKVGDFKAAICSYETHDYPADCMAVE